MQSEMFMRGFRTARVVALRQDLVDATELVWKLQHTLSTVSRLPHDLADDAEKLLYRANVIAGMVAQWVEAEKEHASSPRRPPEP